MSRMRTAVETMTDTTVRLKNFRQDGSSFINQSSLFGTYATSFAQSRPDSSDKMTKRMILPRHAWYRDASVKQKLNIGGVFVWITGQLVMLMATVVFASNSTCMRQRKESALLMCVHADVTGLREEQCDERNKHAEELRGIVQTCLAEALVSDTRSLVEIRSSEVRAPPQVRILQY